MIARIWRGMVPLEKAEGYGKYLADSDRGVRDYRRVPGNRGAWLLRRVQGDRVHFLLISLWDSRAAIEGYAGPDIEQARYFAYDRECLLEPEPQVAHYEVLVAPAAGESCRPLPA
ncbi:MAG: antibiotic biosynthesis monooxygenase [Planctomycetota bacterium]|nr:MAG: antibiotic biosynthesis monooxygenase [Planctomycetota bacterium]